MLFSAWGRNKENMGPVHSHWLHQHDSLCSLVGNFISAVTEKSRNYPSDLVLTHWRLNKRLSGPTRSTVVGPWVGQQCGRDSFLNMVTLPCSGSESESVYYIILTSAMIEESEELRRFPRLNFSSFQQFFSEKFRKSALMFKFSVFGRRRPGWVVVVAVIGVTFAHCSSSVSAFLTPTEWKALGRWLPKDSFWMHPVGLLRRTVDPLVL